MDRSIDDANDSTEHIYQLSTTILGIIFAFSFGTARWYLPHSVIEQFVDIPEMVNTFKGDPTTKLLWNRLRDLEISNLFQLLEIDYWIYQELVESMPLIVLDRDLEPWLGVKSEIDPDVSQLQRIQDHLIGILHRQRARNRRTACSHDRFAR